ncbi:hypothetical protein TNCV_1187681 [Trichonephila clavipes]|nr:hypothetical protein TNCV_1187681 [Trichonephila clavipes]
MLSAATTETKFRYSLQTDHLIGTSAHAPQRPMATYTGMGTWYWARTHDMPAMIRYFDHWAIATLEPWSNPHPWVQKASDKPTPPDNQQ